MMIKDVSDSQQFERQGNQEDQIRRIAALNHMESAPQKDPPRIPKLPKQRTAVFPEVPNMAVPFFRHRVPVDVNPLNNLMPSIIVLAARAQHSHVISVLAQGAGLLPNTPVEGHRQILY